MADKKISQLTAATTPLAGTEVLPIVQSGSTVKVSVDNLTAGKTVSAAQLNVDNLRLDGNTLSSTSTNGDVYLTPNGTGKVAVGSVAPTDELSVEGTIRAASGTNHSRYANNFLRSVASGAYYFDQYTVGQSFIYRVSDASAIDTTAMTVASNGNVTINANNLVVGTAGKGIDFSANTHAAGMTSELLDWYEEGTWTPVVSDGTNDATMGANNGGKYTRIGNCVTFSAQVTVGTIGSVGADARIKGLPFVNGNSTSGRAGVAFGWGSSLNITQGRVVTGYVEINQSYIELQYWDATTGTTGLDGSEISDGGTFFISGHYYVE